LFWSCRLRNKKENHDDECDVCHRGFRAYQHKNKTGMMSAIHCPGLIGLIGCVMKEKTMMMNVTFVVMVLELGTQKKN
jgi:hypothetical protein